MELMGEIKGYEDLKDRAARLSMVLFGILNSRLLLNRDRDLSLGIEICDIIAEPKRFSSPADIKSYDDHEFVERFQLLGPQQFRTFEESKDLAERAQPVKITLRKLLHLQEVSKSDLRMCASFFSEVYESYR